MAAHRRNQNHEAGSGVAPATNVEENRRPRNLPASASASGGLAAYIVISEEIEAHQ